MLGLQAFGLAVQFCRVRVHASLLTERLGASFGGGAARSELGLFLSLQGLVLPLPGALAALALAFLLRFVARETLVW